jgi:hypothetical protein
MPRKAPIVELVNVAAEHPFAAIGMILMFIFVTLLPLVIGIIILVLIGYGIYAGFKKLGCAISPSKCATSTTSNNNTAAQQKSTSMTDQISALLNKL